MDRLKLEAYKKKIAHLCRIFPIDVQLFTYQDLSASVYHAYMSEVYQTGIVIDLSKQKNGHHDEAGLFLPVKISGEVQAVCLATPRDGGLAWFHEHKKWITEFVQFGCDWMALEIERDALFKQNELFRMEMMGFLTLTQERMAIFSHDGIVQEVNERLALLLKKRRSELIGKSVTHFMSNDSWDKIKSARSNTKLKIPLDLPQNQRFIATAAIKPVYSNGQLQSYLMHIQPYEESKKVSDTQDLYDFSDIKGVSQTITSAIDIAKRVSSSNTTILLRGESGTGKEVFAQSIHRASQRKNNPFVAINCAAIPENLLESELFGHVKGAFTDAKEDKLGRVELAQGGTIFLDEIGDMSLDLQVKLLRVIQERKIERVGSTKSKEIDVRIITATHQNLESLVQKGRFREDLYYRLNVIPITIPPLRERKEDIPILMEYFMKTLSQKLNRSPKRLSQKAFNMLLDYDWPGNVRELQNVVQYFVELEVGDMITVKSLPSYLQTDKNTQYKREFKKGSVPEKREKDEIMALLDEHGRDTAGKKKVAKQLGISLATLYRKINKYGIS